MYPNNQRLLFFALLLFVVLPACNTGNNNTSTNAQISNSGTVVNPKTGMQKVTFTAKDSLTITANLFHKNPDLTPVVLCHQANSSKEEYTETAKRLNEMGFNCLAPDQRSGGNLVEGGNNETAVLAQKEGKSTNYTDAQQDMEAAIDYMYNLYKKPVILVGSSYSASLALVIAMHNDKVRAVAAFSPGEYFAGIKSETFVQESIKNIKKPVFITSSKKEAPRVKVFFDAASGQIREMYVPKEEGIHGARALWETTPGSAGYWSAFTAFLTKIK
ncbi:hypothetical protein C7N43_17740 [Sphingobacteriales bacterium UPWRP_1]|nr:hypothetical protein BVG80_03645 [Sphingobacteriales bacterium TSM_CSM]PSJ75688.1 hypothetical protein C7N43_17740 [Sphingobacteriales bacterium UPWRP_1]